MTRILAILSLFFTTPSSIGIAAAKDTIENKNSNLLLFELILYLGITLLLIYLFFWLILKRNRAGKSILFKHWGGIPLGQNKTVQIVEIGKKIYILGVGDNVQLIQVLEKEEDLNSIKNTVSLNEIQTNRLRKWFGKRKKGNIVNQFENELAEKIEQLKERRIQSVNQWLDDTNEKTEKRD